MKLGSTVDDPEVAAMVNFTEGPFSSGGGFSNIFPSVRLLFIHIPSRMLTRSITQVT